MIVLFKIVLFNYFSIETYKIYIVRILRHDKINGKYIQQFDDDRLGRRIYLWIVEKITNSVVLQIDTDDKACFSRIQTLLFLLFL